LKKDLNPIELVWNNLKYFLYNVARPKKIPQLANVIGGIGLQISYIVTQKLILLYKVLSKCLQLKGESTIY
jgi:hypothetical protein